MARALRAVALALLLIAALPAAAERRPAVIVTPGSARTFRAALQRFADLDAQRAEERQADGQSIHLPQRQADLGRSERAPDAG